MTRQLAPLVGSLALASVCLLAAGVDTRAADMVAALSGPSNPQLVVATPILRPHVCGIDHTVLKRRGIAILSPIESPDRCNPPVGGKTIYTHYYPDYCAHRHHGPRVGVPGNGVGYLGPSAGMCAAGAGLAIGEVGAVGSTGYGDYNGARQDEANLLHLGGSSGTDRSGSAPDLIDQIQGGTYGTPN